MKDFNFDQLDVGFDVPALPGMDEADIQTPCLVLDLDALERNKPYLMAWEVAGPYMIEGKPSMSFFDHDFEYLHCRQITTNWDYARDFEPEDRFEPAPEAEMLGQIFNGQ